MKQAALRDMFQKVSKTVCTSAVVVSPDPIFFFPAPSNTSAMKIAENTEENPVYPEPKDEGDIQMECSFA
jgi:hypothetical protein